MNYYMTLLTLLLLAGLPSCGNKKNKKESKTTAQANYTQIIEIDPIESNTVTSAQNSDTATNLDIAKF